MSRSQKAFTLIELLIANAIIAVLAALAIPQYQDFVGRAQVSDAVVLLTASRVDVEEHILERGYFPENETYAVLSTARSGLYTNSLDVTISDTCSTAGQIQATMRPSGVSAKIAGRTFVIERDIDGNWRCARGGDKALADSYLPNSCRTEAAPKHDYPICPRFRMGNRNELASAGGGSTDNHGHGNNYDSVDVSNPGKAPKDDSSGNLDDEKGHG